jgi:penicillin-binding protein 1C
MAPIAGLGVWIALPLPAALLDRPAAQSLTIEDREGVVLRTTRAGDGSRASWTPLADMDPQLIQAFLAVEDRRFYSHTGVDLRAVIRAATTDIQHRRLMSGASTITMQLARLLRAPGHSWTAKIAQALWALRLERHLGKNEILEQYLNRVPLGQGALGVTAAAALYFDAAPDHLSTGQAALLAGLARAPSSDNPFVSAERSRQRRAAALRRMQDDAFVTGDTRRRAEAEPVVAPRNGTPFLAPHFTSRVLAWADDSGSVAEGTWTTSLDVALQAELEGEVRHTVALLADREVRQAAAVVLDNRTGEILAWVGSPDFWADTAGQVDMVTSPRQPGSALKPFLYGLAFDRGFTAASVLPDIPRTYQTSTGPYQPRNYDRRYHGPVLAREALASSFNVPAIELADRLGAPALLHTLRGAGFASLDRTAEFYGLGMALGDGDVTLLELANAYRGLANGGVWRPWTWRRQAPNESAGDSARFISRGSALVVLDILQDPVARIPGFGVETPFDFPFPAAVKTGTSRHYTDNWAVGVTAGFTVAVWAGNFSGRPMRQISGVTGAGPLLHRAMLDVARRYNPGALPSPASMGAVRVRVCRLSGERAGANCPGTDEWFLPGTAPPAGNCAWHQAGGRISWPAEYAEWESQNGRTGDIALAANTGDGTPGRSDSLRILSPMAGDKYEIPPGMDPRYATIPLRASAAAGSVRWFVDGVAHSSARWKLQSGHHAIRAVGPAGQSAQVAIEVR